MRISELEDRLVGIESQIATLRAEQVVLVHELDTAQAPQVDASRSMTEWVQAHLDVRSELANDLVFASRAIGHHRSISGRLADGRCSFDRAIATTKYARTGATPQDVAESFDLDLHGVGRLTAAKKRMGRHTERDIFEARYFTSQVSLDHSTYRFWGKLPGVQGRTLEKAMFDRADELRRESPDVVSSRTQRQADAIVAMAQDSLDRVAGDSESTDRSANEAAESVDRPAGSDRSASTPQISIFVDARSDGQHVRATGSADAVGVTAEVASGPMVGPNILEAMLCSGRIRVIGMIDGKPVTTSTTARAIPPAIRDSVLHRDGGCTVDGCRSRYRLQPHHIHPRSHGGSHDMDNLTTLCWYHHHVAIHGSGYRIDPDSPPMRRRLTRIPLHSGGDPPRSPR